MKFRFRNVLMVLLMLLLVLSQSFSAKAEETSPMQYGTVEYHSTVTDGETINDIYHYSDEWFFHSSAERNDDLALTSMQLTAASSDGSAEGLGGQFLNKVGFTDASFVHNDSEDSALCNYMYAKKQITNGTENAEVIAVVIQSYAFDQLTKKLGWIQNFIVNTDPSHTEHGGFADAADKVVSEIAALSSSADAKYWIMGASRGGALASLISVRLPKAASVTEDNIFTYTFESPAVVNGDAASSAGSNIHNYYIGDDMVTYVPPWNMTVYGNRYDLNTDEINARLPEELAKVKSSLASAAESRDPQGVIDRISSILSVLETAVPSREEYSLAHSDTVLNNGTETVLEYSYQDILVSLMNVVFGMSTEGLDLEAIAGNLPNIYEPVKSLVSGIKTGNSQDYYDAASGLMQFLDDNAISLPLNKTELYGLLKLAGPALVDADFVPEYPEDAVSSVMGYLEPTLMLVLTRSDLTFSHQFETIISRLRVLAPALKLDDIPFTAEEPKAGDDAAKLTEELKAYLASNGLDDVTVSGSWNIDNETLPDNTICYFNVELQAIALEADSDLSVTINGQEPEEPLSIENTGTGCIVKGTWKFVIGTPEKVTVSFDAGGITENPEAITAEKGIRLSEVLELTDSERAEKDGKLYQSLGWRDENGNDWDTVFAADDMTLYCVWAEVIQNVDIDFKVPKAGEALTPPTLKDKIPCHIEVAYVVDEHFDETESFEEGAEYVIVFSVIADDEHCMFDTEEDEYETFNYVGTAFINGEEAEVSYGEDELPYLYISYEFTVPAEEEPQPDTPQEEITYTVTEAPAEWTLGSENGIQIVIKRNIDDSTCYSHFSGAQIDGNALNEGDYTAEAGSTILTLPSDTLNSLSAGEHTITAVFDDGSAETKLTIKEAAPPEEPEKEDDSTVKTGDESNDKWWISLAASSAVILVILLLRIYQGRKNQN